MPTHCVLSFLLQLLTILLYLSPSSACPHPHELLLEKRLFHNASHGGLTARYFRQPKSSGYEFWLSTKLIYCFDQSVSSAVATDLATHLNNGWQLWKQADTSNKITDFDLRQGTQAECSSNADRLTIRVNNNADIYTRPFRNGYINVDPAAASRHPSGYDGVLAHEIGHVWGLAHEHQRPDVYGQPLGSNSNPRVQFRCSALADWERVGSPAANSDLCTSYSSAVLKGFSAAQFLPIQVGAGPGFFSAAIDYTSIMFYSGQAGAKPNIKSPFGYRDVTLLDLTNQFPFAASSKPSQSDLDGLVIFGGYAKACGPTTNAHPQACTSEAGDTPAYLEPAECYFAGSTSLVSLTRQ